eukprot:TRINITY_DN8926_c0_g1_i1.p2 TRINITY_DN8926_c0_g1~~TRINITY_DN8926_c0_g1_i1.p2  ORF type:complete len:261 (+),score=105.68 TRINITY_DN8926_c0_g1_i1:37-819(+)
MDVSWPSAIAGALVGGAAVHCVHQRLKNGAQPFRRFTPGRVGAVTVYAASSVAVDPSYKKAAFELGAEVARRGWVQVNGGGEKGLMGAASDGGVSEGGAIDIVILDKFVHFAHKGGRRYEVKKNMPERKRGLYEAGDAFISLPGGLGTLEECLEVLSWRQLGFHDKPVVFINTNGFYNHLQDMLTDLINDGFASHELKGCYFFADTAAEACDFIANFVPTAIDKATIHSGEMRCDWKAANPTALDEPINEHLPQHQHAPH